MSKLKRSRGHRKARFSLREKYGDLAPDDTDWKEYIETVKKLAVDDTDWKDFIETVKKKGWKKASRSRANEKPIQGRAKKTA